ncbi:WXG100 family type VII secretion target [Streptomyces sp. NPDC059080]|uniref:WXG100 family type VII secretion target n=1 Tax=Streptomyces sp. NPDC059080 TaxID=3346718 RepID=UPI0036A22B73
MELTDFSANHAAIDQGHQELVNYTQTIENYLDELNAQVNTVRSEMSGQAIDAYDNAHRAWIQKVDEMRATLGMGGRTLGQVRMNYQHVDGTEQAKWGALTTS